MKKLLFVFLFMPVYCLGQHFEIGINGGISVHLRPINNPYTLQDKPIAGFSGSLKGVLDLPHFQVGVSLDMTNLSETNYLLPMYTTKVYNRLAYPLITPCVFLNHVQHFSNVTYYYGIALGAAIARVGINTLEYNGTNHSLSGYSTQYNSVRGYVAGIQGGFSWWLRSRLALNGEVSVRYTGFSYNDPANSQPAGMYHYQIVYVPITVGIRYRIE